MSTTLKDFHSIDHRAPRAGAILLGLASFREAGCNLLLDIEGREAVEFSQDRLGVTVTGITVDDEIVIHFDGLKGWGDESCGSDSDGPALSFAMQGRKGYICPAEPIPELLGDIRKKVERFFHDWDPEEHFHVSDLDGSVRGEKTAIGFNGTEADFLEGTLRIRDELFPVDGIVWFDGETDGDGNTHWHLVTRANIYRRISFGDLGR